MKRVLVIGAGPLQLPLIRKVKSLGFISLTVDGNDQAVGFAEADGFSVIDIRDREACLAYARKEEVHAVVTAATDFGIHTIAHISDNMGLIGISPQAAEIVKDKSRIRNVLKECGIGRTVHYTPINAQDTHPTLKDISFPVIVKPIDGSGSAGVTLVREESELSDAVHIALNASPTQKVIAEEFIIGTEYGVEAFVETSGQVHILAILSKRMTSPPYFAELGHTSKTYLSEKDLSTIKKTAIKAISAIGIGWGCVNMDILVTPVGEIAILDVGARMGGNLIGSHIVPLSTGIDVMKNLVLSSLGEPCNFTPSLDRIIATSQLLVRPGKVTRIGEWQGLVDGERVLEILPFFEAGDEIKPYRTNRDTSGYVVAAGKTPEDAETNADHARTVFQEFVY